MGSKVLKFIVNEIIEAKYFSISVYSALDISHSDHLTVILRHVSSNREVVERFVTFIHIVSRKGEELVATFFKDQCKIARG